MFTCTSVSGKRVGCLPVLLSLAKREGCLPVPSVSG